MNRSEVSEGNRQRVAVPLLDLKAQFAPIKSEVMAALERVADAQGFILGPEVQALEEEVAAYCDCQFAVGVSSGTDALLTSLMAIDLKPGDEVITTSYSFFATAGSIARVGAVPVFVDIDPVTFNIDPLEIEKSITDRTRALLPVHLFGQSADMDPIMAIAEAHGLRVIEDAAQAIGAEYKGRRVGAIGDMGCLSFYPSKNLGAFGDGGMVLTNDPELASRLRMLRNHGWSRKYRSELLGGNFRLDALQAAVLRVKLPYLDDWTRGRQRNAALFRDLLEEAEITTANLASDDSNSRIELPKAAQEISHIYNQFVIRLRERDALVDHLSENRIGSEIYYPVPLHLQETFSSLGYRPGDLPNSESAANQTIALPIYPELTRDMVASVVTAISDFCEMPNT